MKIYFKNVQNGDSILFEWELDGVKKYGILDCAKASNGSIPLIEELRKKSVTEIDFVIISHPHSDHCSGFLDLFYFCKGKNIRIRNVFHTVNFANEQIIKMFQKKKKLSAQEGIVKALTAASNIEKDKDYLESLYSVLRYQGENNNEHVFIDKVNVCNSGVQHDLSPDLKLKFHAPGIDHEITRYFSRIFDEDENVVSLNKERDKNNPLANYLATFIELCLPNYSILFLSDIEQFAFKRIINNNYLNNNNVAISQLPHHGSSVNFDKNTWDRLIESSQLNVSYIISAGNRYQHPGSDVVKYFSSNDKTSSVFCTNLVNGFKEVYRRSLNTKNLLDDKFEFNNTKLIAQPQHNDELGDIEIFLDEKGHIICQSEKEYYFAH